MGPTGKRRKKTWMNMKSGEKKKGKEEVERRAIGDMMDGWMGEEWRMKERTS